jgi:hypothetical protein
MSFVTKVGGASARRMVSAACELRGFDFRDPAPGHGDRAGRVAVRFAVMAVTAPTSLAYESVVRHAAGDSRIGTPGAARAGAAPAATVEGGCSERRGRHRPGRASKLGAE